MPLLSFAGSPHGGRQRLLPEWNSQPPITPTTILDHSIVGTADGAFGHFLNNTGIESHFIVDLDGEIQQLMNTSRQADANLDANRFALSIETADNGDPDHFGWTGAQLESLAWLHNKLVAVHRSIPRRKVTDCSGRGLGYHTILGAPSCFTPVSKTCPGKPARIDQWNRILLPAFLAGEDLDMALTAEDKQWLQDDLIRLVRLFTSGDQGNSHYPATDEVVRPVIMAPSTTDLGADLDLVKTQLAELKTAIDNLAAGGPPSGYSGTIELTPNP